MKGQRVSTGEFMKFVKSLQRSDGNESHLQAIETLYEVEPSGKVDVLDRSMFAKFYRDFVGHSETSSIILRQMSISASKKDGGQNDLSDFCSSLATKNIRKIFSDLLSMNLFELFLKASSNLAWSFFFLHKTIPNEKRIRGLLLLKICRDIDQVTHLPDIEAVIDDLNAKILSENLDELIDLILEMTTNYHEVSYRVSETDKSDLFDSLLEDIHQIQSELSLASSILKHIIQKVLNRKNIRNSDENVGSLVNFSEFEEEINAISQIINQQNSLDESNFRSEVSELVRENISSIEGLDIRLNIFVQDVIIPFFFTLTHLRSILIKRSIDSRTAFKLILNQLASILKASRDKVYLDTLFSNSFNFFVERTEKILLFFFDLVQKNNFSFLELVDILESKREIKSDLILSLEDLDEKGVVNEFTDCFHKLEKSAQDQKIVFALRRYSEILEQVSNELEMNPSKVQFRKALMAILNGSVHQRDFMLSFLGVSKPNRTKISQQIRNHQIVEGYINQIFSKSGSNNQIGSKKKDYRSSLLTYQAHICRKKVQSVEEVSSRFRFLGLQLTDREILTMFIFHHPQEKDPGQLTVNDFISYFKLSIAKKALSKTFTVDVITIIFHLLLFILLSKLANMVVAASKRTMFMRTTPLFLLLSLLLIIPFLFRRLLRFYNDSKVKRTIRREINTARDSEARLD